MLVIFVLYPIVDTVYVSFLSKDKVNPLINTANILQGLFPMGALIHNLIWITIHLPVTILLGLAFAVLLRDVKGGTIVKAIVFLGIVVPLVIGGVLFRYVYDKDAGVVNAALRVVGLGAYAMDFTQFRQTALFSVILGSIWIWTGFAMIIYSAGLEGIPKEVYEAAEIDGTSRWRTFWRITVPMLRSTTLVVVTLTLLWELKIFDIVYVVTQGGPGGASSVLAFDMYSEAFQANNLGTGAAIAVIMTLMTFGVAAYLVNRMSKS